jgi:hypothetical protein
MLVLSTTSIICEWKLISFKSYDVLKFFDLTFEEHFLFIQTKRIVLIFILLVLRELSNLMFGDTFDSSNDYHLVWVEDSLEVFRERIDVQKQVVFDDLLLHTSSTLTLTGNGGGATDTCLVSILLFERRNALDLVCLDVLDLLQH